MMGDRLSGQESLFYDFTLDQFVPEGHLLRQVDRFVDLEGVRTKLRPYYSEMGRPSVCPELTVRLLLCGYLLGIRSERRLCEEVHLNLAYRWFCRLGLDGAVPDHSTFSKARHGRFRESDIFRAVVAFASLQKRRFLPSQAKVRSTTQRRGCTTKLLCPHTPRTISSGTGGRLRERAAPGSLRRRRRDRRRGSVSGRR